MLPVAQACLPQAGFSLCASPCRLHRRSGGLSAGTFVGKALSICCEKYEDAAFEFCGINSVSARVLCSPNHP